MPSPSGQYSKLWFHKEANPGQLAAFGALTGLRPYQEAFLAEPQKNAVRYQENRGGVAFDHFDYAHGQQVIRARSRWAMRYSGVHAAWLGHAIGDCVTTPGTPNIHRVDGSGTGQFNPVSYLFQAPVNTGTQFEEVQLLGGKIGRLRMSQSVDLPFVICEMDLVGQDAKYLTTATNNTGLPPDSGGFSPDEPLVIAQHIKTGNVFLYQVAPGGPLKTLQVEEWSIEINNFPEQRGVISNDTRPSEPTRGQVREITGSFLVEEDGNLAELQKTYGFTGTDPQLIAKLEWIYKDPNSTAEVEFGVHNIRVTSIERGVEGTGAQRRRFNFAAQAAPTGTGWDEDFPLVIFVRNARQGPTSSTIPTYGGYV